ncbi:aryl-alcohol oxidase 3 [Stylosanthes scabra]|uniref:Aryl-alcohol oxidase 3 n=1 Tax=Stylosanthes scabra TaxID=79078 RepID=A0ABU6YJP0_9FABA|nr:aryl-alcohol oxidase 3 [Stylosanthes scabra]
MHLLLLKFEESNWGRVFGQSILSVVQRGFTAGSTTLELSCEAIILCCNILVERLNPLKERLQKEMGSIKWETLILQAYMQAVNLSTSTLYVLRKDSTMYLN